MKKQNDQISANEVDSRNSQKHNVKVSSRKRDEPEDKGEVDHENVQSNANKKARVASLPEPEPVPEHGQVVELPASFNTLDDDCLGNVLDFVGKKCYSTFGRVNKRCNEMFRSKGLHKRTYLIGYGPLHLIQQQRGIIWNYNQKIAKGVLHYNRRDILDWMFTEDDINGYERLNWLCKDAIVESRLDILREVFERANERQLKYLSAANTRFDLCNTAAGCGELECLKFLRENGLKWYKSTWLCAKLKGQEHILQYLRNNGFPTEWEVDIVPQGLRHF